jgi:hypothetical protein
VARVGAADFDRHLGDEARDVGEVQRPGGAGGEEGEGASSGSRTGGYNPRRDRGGSAGAAQARRSALELAPEVPPPRPGWSGGAVSAERSRGHAGALRAELAALEARSQPPQFEVVVQVTARGAANLELSAVEPVVRRLGRGRGDDAHHVQPSSRSRTCSRLTGGSGPSGRWGGYHRSPSTHRQLPML